jgi:hypothetical protein
VNSSAREKFIDPFFWFSPAHLPSETKKPPRFQSGINAGRIPLSTRHQDHSLAVFRPSSKWRAEDRSNGDHDFESARHWAQRD